MHGQTAREEDGVAGECGAITAEHPLTRALAAHGPIGWQRVEAIFALTVTDQIAHTAYLVAGEMVSVEPPEVVLELVKEQRLLDSRSDRGPWWRISVTVASTGVCDIAYDYGEQPFPAEYLFPPDSYRADIHAYPRKRLPVWLAAYIFHGDRQRRDPQTAADDARRDQQGHVWSRLAANEFPPFPVMWARWSCLAAAFAAAESDRGPRMLPWIGIFENTERSGATLHALPGGRAVLSGGVWQAPALDSAYNDSASLPELYAGAPNWVTDVVLNPRAGTGLLSFCYWWEHGHWYRGDSPSANECAPAVPGVWTVESAVDLITEALGAPSDSTALGTLLSTAEQARITRDVLATYFGGDDRYRLDDALHQFACAGLTSSQPAEMPRERALALVRDYVTGHDLDTTGYPLEELVAHRFAVGWVSYVPVPHGVTATGRAIFYVADDGVLEQSTSATSPLAYIAEFEQRFAQRHNLATPRPAAD